MIRPSVSVVVPFRGNEGDARRLAGNLSRLELRDDDELIVADNSGETSSLQFPSGGEGTLGLVVPATGERSSYHARNIGAAAARHDWILFIDSDCVPSPALLDSYFDSRPDDSVGILAGAVTTDPDQDAFLARYAKDRNFLDQDTGLHTAGDAAATANLMVRREAFEASAASRRGSGPAGDVDLCRRLLAKAGRSSAGRQPPSTTSTGSPFPI